MPGAGLFADVLRACVLGFPMCGGCPPLFSANQPPFRTLCIPVMNDSEVPRELEKDIIAKFGPSIAQVGVNLVNKTEESYVPPKQVGDPKIKPQRVFYSFILYRFDSGLGFFRHYFA